MQRANQAYARNGLLELLALQIETEQIDAGALASMPEARLRHYNEVLLEQSRMLETQVQERVAFFRIELNLTAPDVTLQYVDQALSAKVAETCAFAARIERDSKKLGDPRLRRSILDELPDAETDDPDPWDVAAFAAAFGETLQPARPAARRRKRRKG